MKYDFDEVIDRHNTFSMKWDCREIHVILGITPRFDEDTIPIHTADMDFRCCEPIQRALRAVTDHNIYGYTGVFPGGYGQTYYDAVIGWFKRRHDWDIKAEEIVYANGTMEAIRSCIEAFTEPGDGIMITRPVYTPFTGTILKTRREVVNSPLVDREGNGFYEVDYEDFEAKAALPSTKMFLLCSPQNPTGRIFTDEELLKMAEICRRHDVLIVADEIHGDLIRRGNVFHPIAKVAGPEGIITCTALNKTFNIAGLQATNIVIQDPALLDTYRKNANFVLPNPFTAAATVAAYNEGEEWLEQLIDYLDDNIDFVIDFFREHMPKVKIRRPEGTYILWMDFRDYGLTGDEIRERIYEKANVMLESGPQFDPERGEGFERMCVPTRRSLLKEALERIAAQFPEG
ncbi:MAG: pyridoxal phosphate-dependent aminotransferase [Lachnospiraceae bacterium]|nr:pyridoxal phosphate-dependent aminotransferase [Lachnospiraceae bacterium]